MRSSLLRATFVGFLTLAVATVPTAVRAIVPVDGGPLVVFPVTIHAGSGDQYHAHVDGDLASYTDDNAIRYYDFFTGAHGVVPRATDEVDHLSDVGGSRIVFVRDESSGRAPILVYDTLNGQTTEVDPQPFPLRSMPGIGGNTIAFIDLGVTAAGELFAAAVGGVGATRLTTDTRIDLLPSVSPLGNVIVWESCASSPTNCDIHQALRSGVSWSVGPVTTTPEPESYPHTDGVVIAYASDRAGEQDVYWQSVGGGPEQRLELPGFQRYPSVSGGVITFEGERPGDGSNADLFAYEIATNKLYRITSTEGSDEQLNDVAVLPDGRVRVVWNWPIGGARDVYGATFSLPCDALTWYRDADGDGYGDPGNTLVACTRPDGYTDGAADCDDSNPLTYPYAVEVKDGVDNQCPDDECANACGYGVIDEVTGTLLWTSDTTVTWPSQGGAEGYEVVRSPTRTFVTSCVTGGTSLAAFDDPSIPSLGGVYYYLVRSVAPPPPGSWGQRSDGSERTGGCLPM